MKVGEQEFIFVDGGMTMYNNPAFQLFLMATVEAYILPGRPVKRNCYSSLSAPGPIRRRMQISRLDK